MEHARAEGFVEIRLEVSLGNTGALELYKGLGFKSKGETDTGKIMSFNF
jgi:ribosomal protein S18 acetylase RimI-like enzyme